MSDLPIVVIGAGIVGTSTALALQRDGLKVILIDRDAPCAGASFGNAGAVVDGACSPTAMPGALGNAVRMLSRPFSPLSIRPAYAHRILPWLIRFVLESRRSRVSDNARHLYALTARANDSWRRLTDQTAASRYLNDSGWLKVYESDQSFAATQDSRDLMDANGARYEVLSTAEIRDLEPRLAANFARGIFQADSLAISNPQQLVETLVHEFVSHGGIFRRFEARSLEIGDRQITLRYTTESLAAQKIVIAAGARSKALAMQAGDAPPLDAERGYHLMFGPESRHLLSRPVMNADTSFVLAPMESGLRLTSQVEFAGVDAAPDYAYIRRLVPLAKRMLPDLSAPEESVWMGCRPSLPDSLPVIGFSSRSNDILYAFGHQHIGMTLGPATGFIIADLVAGRDPGIDISPYRSQRY